MFGTTHPGRQELNLGAFLGATAIGGVILAATIALAAVSMAINGSASTVGTAAAPAPLTAPAVRDLGSRDAGATSGGLAANAVRDLGVRDLVKTPFQPGGFGPGAQSMPVAGSGASGFEPGFLVDADQRRQQSASGATSGGSSTLTKDDILPGSSEGAPAARHAGPRAQ
jgi:hypothetical protein